MLKNININSNKSQTADVNGKRLDKSKFNVSAKENFVLHQLFDGNFKTQEIQKEKKISIKTSTPIVDI